MCAQSHDLPGPKLQRNARPPHVTSRGNAMSPANAPAPQQPAAQMKQNPLTLIMKIKSPEDSAALQALLGKFLAMPRDQNPIDVALDRLAKVHFARFVFLDDNT